MKKQYENPIIEIIVFDEEDVITTSSFGNPLAGLDNDDDILG